MFLYGQVRPPPASSPTFCWSGSSPGAGNVHIIVNPHPEPVSPLCGRSFSPSPRSTFSGLGSPAVSYDGWVSLIIIRAALLCGIAEITVFRMLLRRLGTVEVSVWYYLRTAMDCFYRSRRWYYFLPQNFCPPAGLPFPHRLRP